MRARNVLGSDPISAGYGVRPRFKPVTRDARIARRVTARGGEDTRRRCAVTGSPGTLRGVVRRRAHAGGPDCATAPIAHTAPVRYASLTTRLHGGGSRAWEVHERGCVLAAEGRDVILLSIGEPDFPAPPHVVDALVDSIQRGRNYYTPSAGEGPLRTRDRPPRRALRAAPDRRRQRRLPARRPGGAVRGHDRARRARRRDPAAGARLRDVRGRDGDHRCERRARAAARGPRVRDRPGRRRGAHHRPHARAGAEHAAQPDRCANPGARCSTSSARWPARTTCGSSATRCTPTSSTQKSTRARSRSGAARTASPSSARCRSRTR